MYLLFDFTDYLIYPIHVYPKLPSGIIPVPDPYLAIWSQQKVIAGGKIALPKNLSLQPPRVVC
jgi:hypothetical protein